MRIQKKNTPVNAENLEMLFSEMYILKNSRGGGGSEIYWDSFVWADCEHYITTSMVILDTTISQTLSHFGDQISIYLIC